MQKLHLALLAQASTLKRVYADLHFKKNLSPLVLSLSKYSSGKVDKSKKIYAGNCLFSARINPSLDSHFMLTRDGRERSGRAECGSLSAHAKVVTRIKIVLLFAFAFFKTDFVFASGVEEGFALGCSVVVCTAAAIRGLSLCGDRESADRTFSRRTSA